MLFCICIIFVMVVFFGFCSLLEVADKRNLRKEKRKEIRKGIYNIINN